MKRLALIVLAASSLSAAPATQTFTGRIIDDICADGGHSQMMMGPTDGECTVACVLTHGAKYMLYDNKNLYILSDEKAAEKFAGARVKVTGTLNVKTNTIQVASMTAAK